MSISRDNNSTAPEQTISLPLTELDINSTAQRVNQSVVRQAAALLVALTIATSTPNLGNHIDMRSIDAVFAHRRRGERNDTMVPERSEVDELFSQFVKMINNSDERFEDGEISNLARLAINLVEINGTSAFSALNDLLNSSQNELAVAEILKWIGRINNQDNIFERASLAARNLSSKSEAIRDASALLLADFSLKYTRSPIEQAIKIETEEYIKDTLIYALKNLGKHGEIAQKD